MIISQNSEGLLSPSELAAEYKIKEGTQAVWRCTGRYGLPYLKVGRLVRYRRSDVEAWLETRSMGGVAA